MEIHKRIKQRKNENYKYAPADAASVVAEGEKIFGAVRTESK